MSGSVGRPLHGKLGYKPGLSAHTANAPENYLELLDGLPEGVRFVAHPETGELDLVHLFTAQRAELGRLLPVFRIFIRPNGMIWVSWPKKSSGVPTDVSGDVIRAEAFPLDLVDVKVCSVDQTWTAVKLMIRKEKR